MKLSILFMLALLYLPGSLGLFALGFSPLASCALSPIISVVWLGIAGVLYCALGIPANPFTMGLPILIIAVVLLIAMRTRRLPRLAIGENLTVPMVLTYIAISSVVCYVVFVGDRVDMEGFIWMWDNDTHLNTIRAFADSQSMSTLQVSSYLTAEDEAISPYVNNTGYYPAVYYELSALAVQATGRSAALSINASIVVIAAVVYPVSMALFISEFAPDNKVALWSGAFLCGIFPAFPYALLLFGPLYPNIFALALLPLGMAIAHRLIFDENDRRPALWCLMLLCLIALGLVHPNADFSLGVIAVPALVIQVARKQRERGSSRLKSVLASAGVFCIFALLWVVLYNLPQLSAVRAVTWRSYESVGEALIDQVLVSPGSYLHSYGLGQPLLFVLIVVGAVYVIYQRKNPGIVVSFVALQIMCIVSATTEGDIKQFLTGFWYTDTNRLAAVLAIVSAPLAAEGVAGIATAVPAILKKAVHHRSARSGTHLRAHPRTTVPVAPVLTTVVVIAIVMAEAFPPATDTQTDSHFGGVLGQLQSDIDGAYGDWNHYLVFQKDDVEKILTIVGDDTVANSTYDGSFFAYGSDDLRVLYRTNNALVNDQKSPETADSVLIRTRLCDISTDTDVQDAVSRLGIKWVVQLDTSGYIQTTFEHYSAQDWVGIESIDENTPGFELVYANDEESIRLYRITVFD